MVDWGGRMWVLLKHKGSRTQRTPRPRIIGMGAEVEAVLRVRQEKYGSAGHVFLNADGKPWTKDALALRMRRLRKRAGVEPDERGEQFVLYTNRHTFLTQAGADPSISHATLMDLAGHTDPRTTAGYIHAARQAVAAAGRRVADGLNPSGQGKTA
ncbi:MAG: site-specific tyrosine recombinase XerC [Gemmataceae bacterium]|nr:site-specific tyrosine recombinase XerC [Gemmataceae bacterium]